ncbi:MAG: pyridoxamine kinase [Clostridiales bacterium]|jgi:pyridoxine kinase|nr:pyridoxamine kinase [Clostridiales bacterium]
MKNILAIHDISSLGKASLTVVIPILSVMGARVCPLPTSVLSSVTRGYGTPEIVDLTDFMRRAKEHFARVDAEFDWIYSGFLGAPQQADIIMEMIRNHASAKALIDPVFGDEGKLYSTMSMDMVRKMRDLVRYADVITPNWTEAQFLTGKKAEDPRDVCLRLCENSVKKDKIVVITSVPNSKGDCVNTVLYEAEKDEFEVIYGDYTPHEYSGAGDGFASVLLGALIKGNSLDKSAQNAAKFIALAVEASAGNKKCELEIEKVLDSLLDI